MASGVLREVKTGSGGGDCLVEPCIGIWVLWTGGMRDNTCGWKERAGGWNPLEY